MKVAVPFKIEHSWCRGKNHTIRHTFMVRALAITRGGSPWYTIFSPRGYASLGGVSVLRRREA
jgi:hypothetical protein